MAGGNLTGGQMDEHVLIRTRRSLHAVAELVLAGPQYRQHGTIRLQVKPNGFGQIAGPLRVERDHLVADGVRLPLVGTVAKLAAAVGVEPGAPQGLYHDHADLGPHDELEVDPVAAEVLLNWFERGERALRTLDPNANPVLWPEHFDLGIQLDEVNYGVSPGDAAYPRPYAYVGPWTPRQGPFWNAPFGALRHADELPDADAVAAFFTEGRIAAADTR
jgi:hypothetical protein